MRYCYQIRIICVVTLPVNGTSKMCFKAMQTVDYVTPKITDFCQRRFTVAVYRRSHLWRRGSLDLWSYFFKLMYVMGVFKATTLEKRLIFEQPPFRKIQVQLHLLANVKCVWLPSSTTACSLGADTLRRHLRPFEGFLETAGAPSSRRQIRPQARGLVMNLLSSNVRWYWIINSYLGVSWAPLLHWNSEPQDPVRCFLCIRCSL